MDEIIAKIRDMIEADMRHRSGFRLQEATNGMAAEHTVQEAIELREAVAKEPVYDEFGLWRADVLHELAGSLGCLLHLAAKLEFTEEEIKAAVFRKFEDRFEPGPTLF